MYKILKAKRKFERTLSNLPCLQAWFVALIAVFIIMVCPRVLFYEVEQNGIGVTGFATLDVKKDIRHLLKEV